LKAPLWSISARRRPYPEFDLTTLTGEDLDREFAAVFSGHCTLHALDDSRDRTAIIFELLGAVVDAYAGALANILIIGAFVRILKAAPAAYVVNENRLEVCLATLDV
jgi:hypothetical protein